MRTRYTVIREIYVAFDEGREVWFLDSAYTRHDDILIGSRAKVEAFVCEQHGFVGLPSDWDLIRIPDVETFDDWFGIL